MAGLLYYLIDVGEVATLVVVVEAIAYDEVVLDIEATIVNLQIYLQATGLNEERSDEYFFRFLLAQHVECLLHGEARLDDVFDDDYGATLDVLLLADELLHLASRLVALIG